MALDRAGTACGSSMVDVAMSSRRVVAASSLAATESDKHPERGLYYLIQLTFLLE